MAPPSHALGRLIWPKTSPKQKRVNDLVASDRLVACLPRNMRAISDPADLPQPLRCPACHASQLRLCGELLLGPYQQLLVACLECERVFVYHNPAVGLTPH